MMDPVSAALAGGIIEGGLSYMGQSSANKANRSMAREQMDFQERMSNSAYQRAMADMRKAGLNPILAGKLGGASAPPGAMSQVQNELSGFGGTTAKGLEARRVKTDIANSESQIGLNKANSAKAAQEAKLLGAKVKVEDFVAQQATSASKAVEKVKEYVPSLGHRFGGWLYDKLHPKSKINVKK